VKARLVAALARGKACVCSSAAASGLPLIPNRHFLLANTADQFVAHVHALLESEELRQSLGLAARQYAERELSPDVIGRRWETLYEDAICKHRNLKGPKCRKA